MSSLRSSIATSALAGASMLVVFVTVSIIVSANLLAKQQVGEIAGSIPASEQQACIDDPEGWHLVKGVVMIWAYDIDGKPSNPHGPTMTFDELPDVGDPPLVLSHFSSPIRHFQGVHRMNESGPCAVIVVNGPDELPLFAGIKRTGFIAMIFGLAAVFIGTMMFSVRPLLARITVLANAAHHVGSTGPFPVIEADPDELGDVTRALQGAHQRIQSDREELARRHQILERHLASVAHDLRTPLAALQLTLEALAEKVPTAIDADVGEAQLEVAYLEALADNLHHASRLTGGLMVDGDATRVDLSTIVRRVGLRFAILGRSKHIEVCCAVPDEPLYTDCDSASAERAIANLVHNALVHGPDNHPVGIALDSAHNAFRLTVSSGGPVLTEEVIQALSSRQLHDTTESRTRHGEGLGVAIVNAVAKRAGWHTEWIAREDGGLEVRITGNLA